MWGAMKCVAEMSRFALLPAFGELRSYKYVAVQCQGFRLSTFACLRRPKQKSKLFPGGLGPITALWDSLDLASHTS